MIPSLIALILAVEVAAMTSSLFVSVYAQTSTQQPAGDGVSILSSSQTNTAFGSTYIIGEVRNNLSNVVHYVQIVGRFYDSSGLLIDTDFTYTDPSDLAAGQSAPFEITVSDEDISDDIGSVKLAAQSNDYFAIDLELLGLASTQTTEPPPPQQQQQPPLPPAPQLVL